MRGRAALCGALLVLVPATARAETLYDAIAMAYQTNPNLRGQREALRAAGEDVVQARAGYGPQVNLSAQYGYQRARNRQGINPFGGSEAPGFPAYHSSTGQADLSVVQPIYTGGGVRSQIRSASASVLASREALRQSEAQTLQNVITAYVDVRHDREAVRILKDEIDALTGEFAETRAKGALGALTRTDVAQSEARLLAAQAQLNQAIVHLASSNTEYLGVVGQNPGDLAPEPDLPGLPATVDQAFAAANSNNPQLLQAINTERATRAKVDQAKALNAPNLALRLDAGMAPYLPNQDRIYNQNVTVAAVLTKPLFTSGINSSKVRQAQDETDRAQLAVEETRRAVVQQVGNAWDQIVYARSTMALQQRQIEVQKLAVHGNRVEEKVGFRSTIDLLNAELELTDARLGLLQSQHDAYVARATLLAAMGTLEVQYLLPDMQRYDPVDALKRVEGHATMPWVGAIKAIDSIAAPSTKPPALSPPDAGAERPLPTAPPPSIAPLPSP